MSDINDFVDPRLVPLLDGDTLQTLNSLIEEYELMPPQDLTPTDLDKARLCLALLQSMKVKRASTLDALEDEIEYIKAIVG